MRRLSDFKFKRFAFNTQYISV